MKIVGIIPARRGSAGVADKNLRPFLGKPLVEWTFEVAKQCGFDDVIVTSNWPEILKRASDHGFRTVVRPESLSMGNGVIARVCHHALQATKHEDCDAFVLLNPTSPFRTASDVKACIELFKPSTGIQGVVSVVDIFPMVMVRARGERKGVYHIDKLQAHLPYDRRQRMPIVIQNGAVYLSGMKYFNETLKLVGAKVAVYKMPKERSVDLDDIWDWMAAEAIGKELLEVGSGQIPS